MTHSSSGNYSYMPLHSLLKEQMGLMFFVLCWKLAKSPRSQGVRSWMHSSYKIHTKNVYFRNNCVRKRQKDKIKNYSAWQTTLYMLQSKKQRKLLTSFWFWLQQDLKLFSFVWRLIFSQIQQTISIQKNSALPWQCKNIWILQSFENAQLTFLSSS